MKKNWFKHSGNTKHPWLEEQVERWVLQFLRWQGRMACKLQHKMNRLSPADQRRVWFFYVVGFSCCISVVLIRPFLKEDATNGLEYWIPVNAPTWRAPLSLSQHSWILFPPLYSRFSAAFDSVSITHSTFLTNPLNGTKSFYESVKQDSICKP